MGRDWKGTGLRNVNVEIVPDAYGLGGIPGVSGRKLVGLKGMSWIGIGICGGLDWNICTLGLCFENTYLTSLGVETSILYHTEDIYESATMLFSTM